MKILIYTIIVLLCIFITYSIFYGLTNNIKEGATANNQVSAEQCQTYVSNNTIIDSTNVGDFVACNGESITDINQLTRNIKTMLQMLEPSSNSFYLINTFSNDVSNAMGYIDINSLPGQAWNTAANRINNTSSIVSTLTQDQNYLVYLTRSPLSNQYPDFSQGSNIPVYIQSEIQGNSCTPLIDPSFNQNQLDILNQTLQTQKNTLANLEADIAKIRERYPIQFSVGTVSVNSTPGASPQIVLSGQIPNIVMDFTILSALDGDPGTTGEVGIGGKKGDPGLPGPKGLDGYWGSVGVLDNVYG